MPTSSVQTYCCYTFYYRRPSRKQRAEDKIPISSLSRQRHTYIQLDGSKSVHLPPNLSSVSASLLFVGGTHTRDGRCPRYGQQAAQALTGTGGAKADYLSAGRALEQNRDWSGAIDAYLKV